MWECRPGVTVQRSQHIAGPLGTDSSHLLTLKGSQHFYAHLLFPSMHYMPSLASSVEELRLGFRGTL
jgi:hypothetical protein